MRLSNEVKKIQLTSKKATEALKNHQLKALLRPLKRQGKGSIPANQDNFLDYYSRLKDQHYLQPAEIVPSLTEQEVLDEDDADNSDGPLF